ncbi:E3 ubiquitin-protein ligase RNF169 [Phycodurus eques]|uniref:E3 ubiquitin-protein ligase RNF169 n=1 Tax=Phycodurus eques TaxID=693459 RepID=UPI002ACE08DA|nr:E3 ubiquitin-protein ligase RNF169 [Phycodurus eques]
MAAAAGTGRRSGKATDAAAGGSRFAPGLGTAAALDAARSSAEDGRSRSSRGRRSGEAAERRGGGGGGGAAGWRDAAEEEDHPRARRPDVFVCPSAVHKSTEGPSASPNVKHKLSACDEREDARRRSLCKDESGSLQRGDDCGVLSDSENEEPVSRRIRRVSAFVRRSRTSSGVSSGAQRSRSCTEAADNRGRKTKGGSAPAATPDTAGAAHSFAAGILLSSENSRSASAPVGAPERRPARRAGAPPPSAPSTAPPERSVSPESNDSISEELNHFKPIVCSPCTPPKRLADGRLLEPAVVKSTPRNLTWRLHKPTSYEASPAVLQRWRQIELDRQSCKVDTKGTLTSPVKEIQEGGGAGGGVTPSNKRKLLFDAPGADAQSLKIRVPAVRYGGDLTFRGNPDFELGDGVGALFGRRHSFSPYAHKSGFQSCKLAPKDSLSPREEAGASKRSKKTKHQDSAAADPQVRDAVRRERRDRALALKLQRQFDRESAPRPAKYFLRSWMANHSRRRRGLRRSRRINKQR